MARRRAVKYTGVLAKPIIWKSGGLADVMAGLSSEESFAKHLPENNAQIEQRTMALFAHYEIEPLSQGAFSRLAWALAKAHVPGCEVIHGEPPRGKGAPSIWKDPNKILELLADVWALQANGKSALSACRILATSKKYRDRYQGRKGRALAPTTLYRLYQGALKREDPILSKLVKRMLERLPPSKDWLIQLYAFDEAARVSASIRTAEIDAKLEISSDGE